MITKLKQIPNTKPYKKLNKLIAKLEQILEPYKKLNKLITKSEQMPLNKLITKLEQNTEPYKKLNKLITKLEQIPKKPTILVEKLTKVEKVSKVKQLFFRSIYFLIPIIASIFYWYEEPVPFSFESNAWVINLSHNLVSILGIFSYVWMCFNILIMIKIRGIERSTKLEGLLNFHTVMAIIALTFGFAHAPLLLIMGTYNDTQIISGTIGIVMFLVLMVLAIIFMTNRLLNLKSIKKVRILAYEKKFRYRINKSVHNITMIAVIIIFTHTLISFTARSSLLMSVVYFLFFNITFIGWLSHKILRKLRPETDPYFYRKAEWDVFLLDLITDKTNGWTLELLKENPTIFPCIQCGTCTRYCPVSGISEGEYNPRHIIQYVLYGFKERLYVDMIPNAWACTQCYSCVENCPQHVKLPELLISLKNKLAELDKAPDEFLGEAKLVYEFGMAIPNQNAITRRRKLLELPPKPEYDLQEIQDMLDMVGLNELVMKPKEIEKNRNKIRGRD